MVDDAQTNRPDADSAPPLDSHDSGSPRIKIGSQRDETPAPPAATENDPSSLVVPDSSSAEAAAEAAAEAPVVVEPAGSGGPTGESAPQLDDAAPRTTTEFPPPRVQRMSSELQAEIDAALGGLSMDELLRGPEPSSELVREIETDQRYRATVIKVHRDTVLFELGGQHTGVASRKQFDEPPAPGTLMDVVVTGFLPDDQLYELAVPGASVAVGDWSDLAEGIVVEARVTGHNKGGLECEVNRIRGFIPASHVSIYRIEDLSAMVGEKLHCLVTEANRQRGNLVLSRRAVLEREREEARQNLLEQLEIGQTHEGVVRRLQPFGAFVDLGGVDGLIHVSQLSWDHIAHPSEVLQEGQRIKVRIEKIDKASGKIGLSYRDLLHQPWEGIETRYPVGTVVPGTVSKIMEFGAFVKLEPGVEGLVHISELSPKRVHKVQHVVREGEQIQVKILAVDPAAQRISLSLKDAQGQSAPEEESTEAEPDTGPSASPSLATSPAGPLQGGLGSKSGGEKFGLKW